MKSMNFYQVTTVNNELSIIVKSPMDLVDIIGYFTMKLQNTTHLKCVQLNVQHCENAIIDREAISIIHDTWVIEEKKTKRVRVTDEAAVAVPKDILKHLSVGADRIEVTSFYNDEGGASKEYRIFAYIVNMCDTLDIKLSYAGMRNNLILSKDKDKISLRKDVGFLHIEFTRYVDKVTTKIIEF